MESNKIIVLISSYNRYNNLLTLITQLQKQPTIHNIRIIVSNDCSTDKRYKTIKNSLSNIEIINTEENNGKRGYWKTINNLFNPLKETEFDYIIQLDDDFTLCNSFIDTTITLMANTINNNNNIGVMSLHLCSKEEIKGNRWGLGNRWVDGGAIYTNIAMNAIEFNIMEIRPSRWISNPTKSSGVWQQVSNRLANKNIICIKPSHSLVKHTDSDISVMNSDIRVKSPINTYNFLNESKNSVIEICEIINGDNIDTPTNIDKPSPPKELTTPTKNIVTDKSEPKTTKTQKLKSTIQKKLKPIINRRSRPRR
jgi:glycosyltransferase involved in cell wall biosynthesis